MTDDALRQLYRQRFDADPHVAPLPVPGSGSNRRFFRLSASGAPSAVGILGPDAHETRAFLSFTETFRGLDLPVPEVYAANEAQGALLEQDLGDTTLFRALTAARADHPEGFPASIEALYRRVLDVLPRFQVEGGRAIDFEAAYPRAAFDGQSIAWDLNYFKYHFLKLAHVPFHEERLERDFRRFADHLLATDTSHFLYRDLQSRNVMVVEGAPWFIDYQGGRRGALHYDVASLLYDAKAELPESLRRDLLAHYVGALERHLPVDPAAFEEHLRAYVLVRILQALGTYGYRGFYERKRHFLLSVAPAITNIERLLEEGLPIELPELRAVLERICARSELRMQPEVGGKGLTLYLGSFSYKRGYPVDAGGHGGGFVFDCRALPNPGREAAYAGLSGLDAAVGAYLDGSEAVRAYLARVLALVDAQLDAYRDRGFNSLSVHFGCTGGQHRSVYLAERLAVHVRARLPEVNVACVHAEADGWPATAGRPVAHVAQASRV